MKLKSVYSNVGEPVSVGVNLFQNTLSTMKVGCLKQPPTWVKHMHTNMGGYVNLVNVLPYEKARPDTKIYSPAYTIIDLLNNMVVIL